MSAQAEVSGAPSLWRNRDFVLLFGAQVVSTAGSGVTTIGLALLAFELSGGASSAAIVGTALTLRIAAFLVFAPWAGIAADRLDRRKILIATDVARVGLLSLFPFISSVWQIYALIFAINALTAFFTPAYDASIPAVTGEKQYTRALSLSRVALDVENILAPALAAILVAWWGVRWTFWFDAATYVVSAALLLRIYIPFTPAPESVPSSAVSWLNEVTYGTRLLLQESSLHQALVLAVAEAAAGAAAIVSTVVYVLDNLGLDESAVALPLGALGVGSMLASVGLARWTARLESQGRGMSLHMTRHRWATRALVLAGLMLGAAVTMAGTAPTLVPFALLWALNGAGQALVAIPAATLLAEHTRPEDRGRAYAAHFALVHLCWLATYPAVGWCTAAFGAPRTFALVGMLCLGVTCVGGLLGGQKTTHAHDPC